MPSILVTNFQDSGEDVMVFTEQVTAAQLKARLDEVKAHYDDCCDIPENEQQFYIYEPCWLTPENEAAILKHHASAA